MKKKLIEALKAKFEGVSESVLDRVATKLAKSVTSEEDVETAVGGVTLTQVLESYADSRATEAANSAIANYEKKHSLKDGKKVEGGEPSKKNEPDDDAPAWAKALREQNEALSKKIAAMEGAKMTESRRAKLDKVLEALSPAQRKAYSRMSVDTGTDDEFEAVLTEIKDEVAQISTESRSKGASFGAPLGGGKTAPEKASKEEVEAVVSKFI